MVALAIDAGGQEHLAVVYEAPKHLPTPELEALVWSIRLTLAEAQQLAVGAVLLTRPGGIPKTSSGKARRSACRAMVLDGTLPTLYEWRGQPLYAWSTQPHDPGSEGHQ